MALLATRAQIALASAFAPERAVAIAARIFTTPPRFAHTEAEKALLATGVRFDVAAPDGRIAAWRFGEAHRDAVLLSHGWGGRGAQLRSFVPALVAAGYQVVLFDHIGHGLSESRQTTLMHFVRGLDAVARHLESEGVQVVGAIGHSLGAAAITAWLNDSGRNLRAVLIAPPTSLERWARFFARRLGLAERLRDALQGEFERRLGRRWNDFELPQAVANIRAPALVIHDADDDDVTVASGLALARAWRGAGFVRTRGLGHRAILRDPGVVADAVDFIARRVVFAPPPAAGERSAFRAPAPVL
jgi:pimeloyl-ACP methyl ester carboxylesterase